VLFITDGPADDCVHCVRRRPTRQVVPRNAVCPTPRLDVKDRRAFVYHALDVWQYKRELAALLLSQPTRLQSSLRISFRVDGRSSVIGEQRINVVLVTLVRLIELARHFAANTRLESRAERYTELF